MLTGISGSKTVRMASMTSVSRLAGAPAATVVFGRGQGMRERLGPLGVAIQPEKEIILIILEEWLSEQVLRAMVSEGNLDKAGVGFVFEVAVEKALGFVEAHELLASEQKA